jgi:hypothetical protein
MTTLTLLTKINNADQRKQIDKILKRSFEGLDVEARITGTVADRWVQIALSGEDEGIAANYIAKEIGTCPESLEKVKRFSTLTGYIMNLEKSREELCVDIGIFQPKTVNAVIPLSHLQARLVDGRKIALKKIDNLFGFYEDMPINIKITRLNGEGSRIEAELSSKQLRKYDLWQESLLDRLLVSGSTHYAIETTLKDAGLNRDVIDVEHLGIFEHALTCKLGTDAAGLIPKIGRRLRTAKFTVFSPKRIRNLELQ